MAAKVNVRKGIQTGAKVAGGTLAVLVFSLLAYLYSPAGQAKIEVPHVVPPLSPGHGVALCSDVPQVARTNLDFTLEFGKKHGVIYGAVHPSDCATLCEFEGRMVPCNRGEITISLRDGAFSDDHCGETVWGLTPSGQMAWATVLLPEKCFPPEDGARFPKDYYKIVMAHELVGHAEGRGHTKTQIVKGVAAAEKTGEFMNASLLKSGWGDAGW